MITRATSEEFQGLVDPYTERPLEVFMRATPHGPLFFAPDAYSPARIVPKKSDATRFRTCRYTGADLTPRRAPDGWYCTGGFDPRRFLPREEFLHRITMRGGVPKYPEPDGVRAEAPVRRGRVTARHRAHTDRNAPTLRDYQVDAVERSLSKFKDVIPGSSTVSMFTRRES